MLDEKVWLAVSTLLIHPKGVPLSLGQDSVQANQVLPYPTLSSMFLWTLLFEALRVTFTITKETIPTPEKYQIPISSQLSNPD